MLLEREDELGLQRRRRARAAQVAQRLGREHRRANVRAQRRGRGRGRGGAARVGRGL